MQPDAQELVACDGEVFDGPVDHRASTTGIAFVVGWVEGVLGAIEVQPGVGRLTLGAPCGTSRPTRLVINLVSLTYYLVDRPRRGAGCQCPKSAARMPEVLCT